MERAPTIETPQTARRTPAKRITRTPIRKTAAPKIEVPQTTPEKPRRVRRVRTEVLPPVTKKEETFSAVVEEKIEKKSALLIPTSEWTDQELEHMERVIQKRKEGILQADLSTNPNDMRVQNMEEERFKELEAAVAKEQATRKPPAFLTRSTEPVHQIPHPQTQKKGILQSFLRLFRRSDS
ncbi:hypothetical protein KW798_01705 [Candidatus Parcubacteria bacterium]|nr:hypothetical protein [Candidatus Parcubacteria bacterium]